MSSLLYIFLGLAILIIIIEGPELLFRLIFKKDIKKKVEKQKTKKMKLTIELVPQTAWYSNVRSNVSAAEWDVLRKACYKKAGYKCEVCGGKGPNHPVECHEIWDYNDETLKQKLIGLVALCPDCHSTKHVGLAQIQGRFDVVLNQLMTVNEITKEEAEKYVNECFDIWEKRSQNDWELDITFLDNKEDERC